MSEPRKNHLNIDGGQVKEDENISSYKPIPESDTEFRKSKSSLSKSKEKVDEAEEKLLQKEDEAKITTRVDMADAKYVVGDHRNGDAKIELDANKKQFSGLTKEELLKYADDPFWVRLRWFMFILFWALWLCMLAGAIAIIVRAPKCAAPTPKTWYEKGPLVEMSDASLDAVEGQLEQLGAAGARGVFAAPCDDVYEVLDEPAPLDGCLQRVKDLVVKAKQHGVNVIVDLVANYVPTTHSWFVASENGSAEYDQYFTWSASTLYDDDNKPRRPNNWTSTLNQPAWSWSDTRKQYYLHQYAEDRADLDFNNPAVVKQFDAVLDRVMAAGVAGVRLVHARQLVVSAKLQDEPLATDAGARGAAHGDYAFYRHKYTSDQPQLDQLLAHWAHRVAAARPEEETVFTVKESGERVELFLLERNMTSLRPPSAAPRSLPALLAHNDTLLARWPALQVVVESGAPEAAALALLLPAAPVLTPEQLLQDDNNTLPTDRLSRVVSLREDASVTFGSHVLTAVRGRNHTGPQLYVCARWKKGHTGYAAVYNPHAEDARADLSALRSVPADLTVHRASADVHHATNYTSGKAVRSDDVLVPAESSVVLSYVPHVDDDH